VYDADLIIVLKEGHVAEQGTHRQLIDRGGIYSELWSSESFLFCGSDADERS
jgi:ABC transporter ATM